jgi:hypothetical protein
VFQDDQEKQVRVEEDTPPGEAHFKILLYSDFYCISFYMFDFTCFPI